MKAALKLLFTYNNIQYYNIGDSETIYLYNLKRTTMEYFEQNNLIIF